MKRKKAYKRKQQIWSCISTMKRKRSEALFRWLKEAYCKHMGIPYHD